MGPHNNAVFFAKDRANQKISIHILLLFPVFHWFFYYYYSKTYGVSAPREGSVCGVVQ
jgi:hypothetical protein